MRCDGVLIITCRSCKHAAVKESLEICYKISEDGRISSLRFQCSKCGSRKTFALPYLPATIETLEKSVNGELSF